MTLFLVRHGSAGHRNGTDPRDRERHLDAEGSRHAVLIAERLAGRPIEVVVSSPFPRCVETVAPLARLLGLDVVTDEHLAEGSDIDDSWSLMSSLAEREAVLCSHGDVIPELVSRNQRRGMRVPGRSGCAKASIWALSGWDGRSFATGDYAKVRDRGGQATS